MTGNTIGTTAPTIFTFGHGTADAAEIIPLPGGAEGVEVRHLMHDGKFRPHRLTRSDPL